MPRKTTRDSELLREVSEICESFPEAAMERSGSHATFRVRKRVFAYFLDNHHGDGIVSVCVKTQLGENRDLVKMDPVHFYLPAYIGVRGWAGFRLDRPPVNWADVTSLIASGYRAVAPKKLASRPATSRTSFMR